MARIIIVAYGSLGDIHPAIALARGLEARGHHAAIATSEPYRAKLTAAGIPFHAVRPDLSLSDAALVRRVMEGAEGSRYLMRELVFPSVRDMHADLTRIAANADLLVTGELACAMPVIAQQRGVPWAFFALSPISFFPVHDPAVIPGPPLLHAMQSLGPAANRFIHFLARIVSYSWWRPVRQLRHELGLPAGESPLFNGKYSPRLNLALFSNVLQPPQPDWPARTRQTGFLFHDEEESISVLPPDVQRFLDSGPPPIVFTLGSAAVHLARDFYEQAAAAAQLLGRRAILLLGGNARPAGLPDTVLSWGYLPYARIFPHAAAIVHQGGVGTTAQALRAGRPMLVMPFAHDQFDHARRVTRLGIGRAIARKKFTPQSAARELDALFAQPRAVETAAALGAQIRAERGVDAACDALENMLR